MKYVCDICGYVYDEELGDPENDIEPGTKWCINQLKEIKISSVHVGEELI